MQLPQPRGGTGEEGAFSCQSPTTASPTADDPLYGFLAACCERHPHACCPRRELWQAYQPWTKEQQVRFPLSLRSFNKHLRLAGVPAGRTQPSRPWPRYAPQKTRWSTACSEKGTTKA